MTRTVVHVLTHEECPQADQAFELVRTVASRLTPDAEVVRVFLDSDEAVAKMGFYGSPTVLVNGEDVEGRTGPSTGLSSREYEGGFSVPPQWMVEASLLRTLARKHILFLCVANSARSQLAEGLARSMVPGGVTVSSAGSQPSQVRPEATVVLEELGIDISSHRSKAVDELDTSTVDTVITLCADEVCPLYLGAATRLHWGLPDPAAVEGDEEARLQAFRQVRDELRRRLALVVAGR
jgi:arsenate reductase